MLFDQSFTFAIYPMVKVKDLLFTHLIFFLNKIKNLHKFEILIASNSIKGGLVWTLPVEYGSEIECLKIELLN